MSKPSVNGAVQRVREAMAAREFRTLADRALLERFVSARDQAAFTALVERHGPMVLGVCRRALPCAHDADDACQATFLVLARKAASVREKESLGSWLHGVAYRVAASLKRDRARRRKREQGIDPPAPRDPASEVSWREVQAVLDEELRRLPERLRAPLILCYLESMTRDEAAKHLGVSPTTLYGRLERARGLMRASLAKRGLTLGAAISSAAFGEGFSRAALTPVRGQVYSLPSAVVRSAVRAAGDHLAGQGAAEGVLSVEVAALTKGVLKSMLFTKLKIAAIAAASVALVAVAVGFAAWRATSARRTHETGEAPPTPAAAGRSTEAPRAAVPAVDAAEKRKAGLEALKDLDKRWRERGMEFNAAAKEEADFDKSQLLAKRHLPAYDAKAVEEFFEIEKAHRGTDVGLFAFFLMMLRAGGYGDPDIPVELGRERALGILREHYLKHQDLDLVFGGVHGGPVVFGAEPFLAEATEKSPHEHVRAAALLTLAQLLLRKSESKQLMQRRLERGDYPDTSYGRWWRKNDQKTLRRLADFDASKAREEAKRLARKVLAEYPKTERPYRVGQADAVWAQERQPPPSAEALKALSFAARGPLPKPLKIPTYAEYAEGVLLELTQLVVGEPAPPLVGRDSEGKEFRLSDCKGEVVVVMFSANYCVPCKRYYPVLRELQKEYAGKSLRIVTVMADREVKTVRDAIARGEITWRAVWDGELGPIARKWNVLSYPTLYVFDKRGILRHRAVAEEDLKPLVADLIGACAADLWPEAGHGTDR